MNNRQSGRRRGRNNNNQRQPNRGGGNHDSGNRIDSRARGNAAQLLEKYRNMARDAQMSGDRVMTEYYLQFADHYFRVLSDARARQEEQRARYEERYEDRDGDSAEGDDSDGDNIADDGAELDPIDMIGRAPRIRDHNDDRGDRNDRGNRSDRNDRGERAPRNGHRDGQARDANRDSNRDGQPRDNNRARNGQANGHAEHDEPAGIDLAVLPPAIGMADSSAADHDSDGDEAPAAPRRRGRPRKAAAGEEAAAE